MPGLDGLISGRRATKWMFLGIPFAAPPTGERRWPVTLLRLDCGVHLARGRYLQGMRRRGSVQRFAVRPGKSDARYNSNKRNDD